MDLGHASDWLKLLPLAWIGSSLAYCAARWQQFSSVRDGALYYEPLAQVSGRGLFSKLIGASAEVAIDTEFLKIRMGFPESVILFFGLSHREITIRRAQIKSTRFSSWMFGIVPTVQVTYEDGLEQATIDLRVKFPDQVLVMLSPIGERT